MASIRANFHLRVLFLIIGLFLLVMILGVTTREEDQVWKAFQERYHGALQDALSRNIDQAAAARDSAAEKKWRLMLDQARRSSQPEIKQVFLPDAQVRDLCGTCHMGMDNPLFREAEHPLRSHPPEILKDHPVDRFGCTLCHQGQGIALTPAKAHGWEANWENPRVPAKYVQGLCLGCHETPVGLKGAEKVAAGRQLFLDHGCFGCHDVKSLGKLPFWSTPLDGAALKIKDAAWLDAWIRKPSEVRPGTRMPAFRFKPEDIPNIAAYIQTLKHDPVKFTDYRAASGDLKEGKRLFTEKGCIGCHSMERGKPGATPRVPNLADAGLKLDPSWLRTWIEKPFELVPTTPMPQVTLTPEEQVHLTAYVVSLKDPEVPPLLRKNLPPGDSTEGQKIIQSLGCFGCHEIKALKEIPLVGVPLGDIAAKRLEELPFGNAEIEKTKWDWLCNKMRQPDIYQTADMPLKMPDYQLGVEEIEALTNYYLHNRLYEIPETYLQRRDEATAVMEKGAWMLDRYNCNGCHLITENDPKPRIDAYFNMKTMAPPRLVDEGARVQSQWFFKYLDRPDELRPWLNIRMPTFNLDYDAKTDLIAYFSRLVTPGDRDIARIPYETKLVKTDYDPEILQMGEYRVITDKCMQCHPVSMDGSLPEDVKLEDLSINLMLSKTRLRYEWIKRFLRDPDKYAGQGTKMPYIYYTPDGIPKISDPEMWIDYTTLYLMFMENPPLVAKQEKVEDVREEAFTDWTSY